MGSIALSAKSVGSEERPPKEVLPCMLSPPFDREKLPFSRLAGYVFRAKQIIAQCYAKPAAYSYFVGCSTGGREGMILSQRYPTVFNGIISGDPAMRTGLSNLAIGKWIPVAYNQTAPKDASGKPLLDKFLSEAIARSSWMR
jgi:Tannase and feruloyl esterase